MTVENQAIVDEIQALRAQWGNRLKLLGHHYQDTSITRLCDAVGDSLELSRIAAASDAERIVFCGVRFMAETADVLARAKDGSDNGRRVYLPAPEAGCPMADMATQEALENAWNRLTAADPDAAWAPIVYVNSSVDVKAFCGRHGGSACTSGNGTRVLKHFLDRGMKILFAPDQHLCSNIMRELGYPAEAVAVWNRDLPDGGLTPDAIRSATLIAWSGCCPIHADYNVGDVKTARGVLADAQLLIHPEAPKEVTKLADAVGSTKSIVGTIEAAQPGQRFIVGTESHLVDRLIANHRDLTITHLRPITCRDMGRTTAAALLDVLKNWPERTLVRVDDSLVADARDCVERMLAL